MGSHWKVKPALGYLPVIVAIGLGIGVANHAIGYRETLLEALLLNGITSICVGLPLVLVYVNAPYLWQKPPLRGMHARYGLVVFGLLFSVIGILASEIELMVRTLGLKDGPYVPFSAGGVYLFNVIMSMIIGFGFLSPLHGLKLGGEAALEAADTGGVDPKGANSPPQAVLQTIPVKIGNAITLLPVASVAMLEAADKYAYLHTLSGEKHLCDYALSKLEQRLPDSFIRVHRSYVVNTHQIARIKPFDKRCYLIEFMSAQIPAVKSSASYQQVLRELTRLA